METTVPAVTLTVEIPPHLVGSSTDVINVEVIAVGDNGNKTITEVKDILHPAP